MTEHEKNALKAENMELLLETGLPDLPPDDMAREVTPWRRSMNLVLAGLALGTLTINVWVWGYIQGFAGALLMLLGFRRLRKENGWFRSCWGVIVFQMVLLLLSLSANASVYHRMEPVASVLGWITNCNLLLALIRIFCFWQGLQAVQKKAGLPGRARAAAGLFLWFLAMCVLALISYSGIVVFAAVVVIYICIFRSLFKVSRELDEAGYAVDPAGGRISDGLLSAGICALLFAGVFCASFFTGAYPMDWQSRAPVREEAAEKAKGELAALGFPEDVLADLAEEDILSCGGALQVVTQREDYPVNEGHVENKGSKEHPNFDVVYDTKELRITGVAVQLPGERDAWRLFHHFRWLENHGPMDRECIALWTADRAAEGWACSGGYTGRLLCEKAEETLTAPYYSLGKETYRPESTFFFGQPKTDALAEFSFPGGSRDQRGYVSYAIAEVNPGWLIDSWCNYTHQVSRFQYPLETGRDRFVKGSWNVDGSFKLVQTALQFRVEDGRAEPLD